MIKEVKEILNKLLNKEAIEQKDENLISTENLRLFSPYYDIEQGLVPNAEKIREDKDYCFFGRVNTEKQEVTNVLSGETLALNKRLATKDNLQYESTSLYINPKDAEPKVTISDCYILKNDLAMEQFGEDSVIKIAQQISNGQECSEAELQAVLDIINERVHQRYTYKPNTNPETEARLFEQLNGMDGM